MIVSFYLTISKSGTIKTTKSKPNLDWNEVSMQMSLELPNHLFERPQIHAKIVVGDNDVPVHTITPEVQNNIKEAIEMAAGIPIKLEIIQTEKPE